MRAKAAEGWWSLRAVARAMSVLTFGCFALLGGALAVPAFALPSHHHGHVPHRSLRLLRRVSEHRAPVRHEVRHRLVHHWVHHAAVHRIAHLWRPPVHTALWRPSLHTALWHPPAHRVWVRFRHAPERHRVWHRAVHHVWRMSCVPFARDDSGIHLTGNAYTWWGHAAGVYARGDAPVPGSVLAFRANTRMRLGHVAVVSRVINRREIEVDQSNWGNGGRITRSVPVIDVSEANDWTAVRVSLGDGRFGSVYPTYGFIYDRPDTGALIASRSPAPKLAANPAPSDLRPIYRGEQVAELAGPVPLPPPWPAHLGHRLHVRFVHHEVRHVTWRHHRAVRRPVHHWAVRHRARHHVVVRRLAMRQPVLWQPGPAR